MWSRLKKYIRTKHWKSLERIKLEGYDFRDKHQDRLFRFKFWMILLSVLCLVIKHGFWLEDNISYLIDSLLQFALVIYIGQYILYFWLSLCTLTYFRKTIVEASVCLLSVAALILEINLPSTEVPLESILSMTHYQDLDLRLVDLCIFVFMLFDFGRVIDRKLFTLNLKSSLLFLLSFLFLILVGMGLLMLPRVHEGQALGALDALFTSISASCVTGLTVVDTSAYFSVKGHLILLVLIQLGGLNMLSFATLFTLFAIGKTRIAQQSMIKDNFDLTSYRDSRKLFRDVYSYTITIEIIGALVIYMTVNDLSGFSFSKKVFYSLFHSVSAFNNAGFSLFTDGLYHPVVRHNYLLQWVVGTLVILGSIGFLPLKDILTLLKRTISRYTSNAKMYTPNLYDLSTNTRISVYTSLLLLFAAMLLFWILENNHAMKEMEFVAQFTTSFFQSVTLRTAGFNTVAFENLYPFTLMFMMFFMFIGASPGSTGGGIKTTTLTVLLLAIVNTLRGRRAIELGEQEIPFSVVMRALSTLILSIGYLFFSFMLLVLVERGNGHSINHLLFEQVSAFATVGLSTGITPELTTAGRIIIMFSMFLGRVGVITLGFALIRPAVEYKHKYPPASIQMG